MNQPLLSLVNNELGEGSKVGIETHVGNLSTTYSLQRIPRVLEIGKDSPIQPWILFPRKTFLSVLTKDLLREGSMEGRGLTDIFLGPYYERHFLDYVNASDLAGSLMKNCYKPTEH